MNSRPILFVAMLLLAAAALPLPSASAHVCFGPSSTCQCPASLPHVHVCPIRPDAGAPVLAWVLSNAAAA